MKQRDVSQMQVQFIKLLIKHRLRFTMLVGQSVQRWHIHCYVFCHWMSNGCLFVIGKVYLINGLVTNILYLNILNYAWWCVRRHCFLTVRGLHLWWVVWLGSHRPARPWKEVNHKGTIVLTTCSNSSTSVTNCYLGSGEFSESQRKKHSDSHLK